MAWFPVVRIGWPRSLAAVGRFLLLAGALQVLAGCESLRYYGQAASGQIGLLLSREPVAELLEDETLSPELRAQLARSQHLLAYIADELTLQPGKRYRSYVALERDAVVYNLIATPPLSITPHRWCYPIVGCAPYRGYFSREGAETLAARFRERGFSTYIGRVSAYSTLGWFADPLLSTFVAWPEPALLELLAHELSHGEVWVGGAVAFNEAFATFVGRQAVASFYRNRSVPAYDDWLAREAAWSRLVEELLSFRSVLGDLYASDEPDARKQAGAAAAYDAFRTCYQAHRQTFGNGRFDRYVASLNDAGLAVLATYQQQVPAFAALFQQQGSNWPQFFDAVRALGERSAEERSAALAELVRSADEKIAEGADHQGAKQVQCKTFARHAVDGHLSGAEDDHVRSRRDR